MKYIERCARSVGLVARPLLGVGLACLVVAILAVGCGGGKKKAALTPEEIERLTYAPKPNRPDQLMVSGEPIVCEDIMTSPPEEGRPGASLRETLIAFARKSTLEQFLNWARPQVQRRLNGNITSIVLYKRAERELGENIEENLEKLTEKELRRYILEEHGGNAAAAEVALQEVGMSRTSFKEWKKRQLLAEYVVASKYRRSPPVSRRDLITQYEQMKDPTFWQEALLQIRLIEITVAKVERKDPNDDPARVAREQAQDLRKRIDAGEDFGALAKEYSHGHRSEQGGLWRPRDPQALAAPYDVLARQSQEMQVGQVTGPIEAPGRFFIMKLEQKQEEGYRPLRDVQEEVRRTVLDARRSRAIGDLEADVARQVSIVDTRGFVDYCLESLYRLAREPVAAP